MRFEAVTVADTYHSHILVYDESVLTGCRLLHAWRASVQCWRTPRDDRSRQVSYSSSQLHASTDEHHTTQGLGQHEGCLLVQGSSCLIVNGICLYWCTVWVKKISPAVFWHVFPNGLEFLINFYTPIIRSFIQLFPTMTPRTNSL